jgi:hypothetical protein
LAGALPIDTDQRGAAGVGLKSGRDDTIPKGGKKMRETDIADYAKRLLDAHGGKAEAEAAAKARQFEEKHDAEQAENWRRIRAVISEMRGSPLS